MKVLRVPRRKRIIDGVVIKLRPNEARFTTRYLRRLWKELAPDYSFLQFLREKGCLQ